MGEEEEEGGWEMKNGSEVSNGVRIREDREIMVMGK